jgi:hypothetical protein
MSPSEYQDLVAFLVKKFDGVETRLSAVGVGQESLRSDVQTVAELVTANGRSIDENRRAIEVLTEKVELNTVGIRAVRDRVATLDDHLRAV